MPKPPIQQAKEHILKKCLPLLEPHHKEMLIPCLPEDYNDFHRALQLPEVKRAIPSNIKVRLQTVSRDGKLMPNILIATNQDAINGNLDRYLKQMGL